MTTQVPYSGSGLGEVARSRSRSPSVPRVGDRASSSTAGATSPPQTSPPAKASRSRRPACTLIDLATRLDQGQLERAINEADRLDLIDPERLRSVLDEVPRRRGLAALRKTLDRRTFFLTDSELERVFIPIVRKAGFARPQTQQYVNGFKVDFYWPDLGLVVETDSLSHHRTPGEQAQDRLRDQVHTAAGLTTLRFSHGQVWYERGRVELTLKAVRRRLS